MMVRCYWCISILIIIPTIRCCSLTGSLSGWSAVVLFDRRYPSFRNFDSTISIDVIRMKSYIAQNAYCSWDIYLQSSYNHRSVILPVLLQLSAFDWLMITRAFFHWE